MLGQPVKLIGLGLTLVVLFGLNQIDQNVDQLLAARRVQARLEARVQGHGAVAGLLVHLLHKLERAECGPFVRHEVAVGHHCLVEMLLVLNKHANLLLTDHLKFI